MFLIMNPSDEHLAILEHFSQFAYFQNGRQTLMNVTDTDSTVVLSAKWTAAHGGAVYFALRLCLLEIELV